MKYLIDGQVYQGRSYTQIVTKMAGAKPERVSDVKQYRETTAARIKDMYKKNVDPKTNKSFLETLAQAGLARRV